MSLIYRRRSDKRSALNFNEIQESIRDNGLKDTLIDLRDGKLDPTKSTDNPIITPPINVGPGGSSTSPTPTPTTPVESEPTDTSSTRTSKTTTSKSAQKTPDKSSNSPLPSTTNMAPGRGGNGSNPSGDEDGDGRGPITHPATGGEEGNTDPSDPLKQVVEAPSPGTPAGTPQMTRTIVQPGPTNGSRPDEDENNESNKDQIDNARVSNPKSTDPVTKGSTTTPNKDHDDDGDKDGESQSGEGSPGNGLSGLSGSQDGKSGHGYKENETITSGVPAASKKKNNAGPIAGGVIGGLLIIGILIALLVFVMKRRKRRHDSIYHSKEEVEPFTDTPETGMTPTSYTAIPPPLPAQNNLQSREIQEPVAGLARSNTRNTAVSLPDREDEQVYTNGNRPPSPALSITMPQSAAGSQNHNYIPPSPSAGSNPQSSIPRLPLYERAPRDSDAL